MSMKVDLELFRIVVRAMEPTFAECVCEGYMRSVSYHDTYCETLDRIMQWTYYDEADVDNCLGMLRILMYLKASVGPEMDACVDVASTIESMSGGEVKFNYGAVRSA